MPLMPELIQEKMPAVETPSEPVATTFAVGDKLLWRGMPLTVFRVFEDGKVHAISPTWQVITDELEQFTKIE
jgi:hypothetical protein